MVPLRSPGNMQRIKKHVARSCNMSGNKHSGNASADQNIHSLIMHNDRDHIRLLVCIHGGLDPSKAQKLPPNRVRVLRRPMITDGTGYCTTFSTQIIGKNLFHSPNLVRPEKVPKHALN